jgi:hypothetical protein
MKSLLILWVIIVALGLFLDWKLILWVSDHRAVGILAGSILPLLLVWLKWKTTD